MLTFKHFGLVLCCTTSLTFCTEPPLDTSKITAGIQELNTKYHDMAKMLKDVQKQQHTTAAHVEATIKQSLKRGWPLSARLIITTGIALGVWAHKDQLTQDNAQTAADHAKAAWDERENIARAIKYAVGSAYYQIKDAITARKNTQQKNTEKSMESE